MTLRIGTGRPHGGYFLRDGSKPLSASQIADALDAPDKREALQRWFALTGMHAFRIADEAKDIGSAVHAAIEAHYRGMPTDTLLWDAPDVTAAENAFAAFVEWHRRTPHTPLLLEWPMVSERIRLAGTLDMLADFGEGLEVVDFKTSKRLSPRSMFVQCALYDALLTDVMPDMPARTGARIVRIPKDGSGPRVARCDGDAWLYVREAACDLIRGLRRVAAVDGIREMPLLEDVEDGPLDFGP